jgi:hypothetical protein
MFDLESKNLMSFFGGGGGCQFGDVAPIVSALGTSLGVLQMTGVLLASTMV